MEGGAVLYCGEVMETELLRQAYRYCEWMTTHHYENFPVASYLLPKSERPAIAAIYAFARSADDFADEAKYQGRSLELLNGWREALKTCSNDSAKGSSQSTIASSHPIFLALADAIHQHHLPVQLLQDLLTAFTMDVTKKRYANWEDLLTYCRYSANPVGRLVLTVFGVRDPALHELSDCICTGLQLANHWQDLSIDFLEKDRLYIPLDLLNVHGVDIEELREKAPHHQRLPTGFRSVLVELVKRSYELFDRGEPLLSKVSGRLRLELKLTVLGGRAILDRVTAMDGHVLRSRPVLSPWAKLNLLAHAIFRKGAVDYCHWLTQQSHSHFALGIQLLPRRRREAMEAVYAFCRAVDDVVDREEVPDTVFVVHAQRELNRWRQELMACVAGTSTHPIAVALEPVLKEYQVPEKLFEALITGVEMDLDPRRRYRTFEELEIYCHHVASVVGLISVQVLGCRHPASQTYAENLGVALQLTNILRDVKADAKQGRVYLPQEELAQFGCSEVDLKKGHYSESFRGLMAFQCERAWDFFDKAREALKASGERQRLLMAEVMGGVYAELLRRIGAIQYDVFTHRVSVPPFQQLWVATKCVAGFAHDPRPTTHDYFK